jgi:hypothetical protein
VGFVARVTGWIGIAAGVVLATWAVPAGLGLVTAGTPAVRLFTGLLILALTVTVVATLFQILGQRVRHTISRSPLSGIDRAAGGVVGVLLVGLGGGVHGGVPSASWGFRGPGESGPEQDVTESAFDRPSELHEVARDYSRASIAEVIRARARAPCTASFCRCEKALRYVVTSVGALMVSSAVSSSTRTSASS